MGLAAIAAAAAPIVGAAVSTTGSAISNRNLMNTSNAFNERMMERQMQYNTEMYERQLQDQLQYTDPGFIKSRLQGAGLNASLMMSGGSSIGSVGNTPQAQGINPPRATAIPTDYSGLAQGLGSAIDKINAVKSTDAQVRNMSASTDNLRVEGQFIAAKAIASLAQTYAQTRNENVKASINEIIKGFTAQQQQADLNYKNELVNNAKMQYQLMNVEYAMQSQNLAFLPVQQRLQAASASTDISLKLAQRSLTRKQAEHEVQKMAETIARTETQTQQTELTRRNAQAVGLGNQFNQATFGNRVETVKAEMWRMINNSNANDMWQFGQNAAQKVRDWFK